MDPSTDPAQTRAGVIVQLCFLASFLWLSSTIERHSLFDQPQLASSLLLFVSGSFVYLSTFFATKYLPGAEGRFDSEAVFKGLQSSLPPRPRRFFIPCVTLLIVLRLEILSWIVSEYQCSFGGTEAYLPFILALHAFLTHRRPPADDNEPEDMWATWWDEFKMWLITSPIGSMFSTGVLGLGVFWIAHSTPRSTYFCSTLDSARFSLPLLEWIGVLVDAAILILMWRLLSWMRTTKGKLRTLGGIMVVSSLVASASWIGSQLYQDPTTAYTHQFREFDLVYMQDALGTGLVLSVFLVMVTIWVCESGPLLPASTTIFASGMHGASREIFSSHSDKQIPVWQPLFMLFAISFGFVVFTYANNTRTVVLLRRGYLMLLLQVFMIISGISAFRGIMTKGRHPVDDIVFRSRVEADRWLRTTASVSTNIRAAVSEYKFRHRGREPPPNFDKWFEYATQLNTSIMDSYDQIDKDTRPFWGLAPAEIRVRMEALKESSDIGIVTVADGRVSHNQVENPSDIEVLDNLVSLVSDFAQHLPPMSFAINLAERPKVLVPWEDIHHLVQTGDQNKLGALAPGVQRRQVDESLAPPQIQPDVSHETHQRTLITAQKFRHLETLACPPRSRARAGVNWNMRDSCTSCAAPHSSGQFLESWAKALDPCHQPDIFRLHEFHLLPHGNKLYDDLVPIFSRSKTDSFSDIIIPLPRPTTVNGDEGSSNAVSDDFKSFSGKINNIFWQGDVRDVPMATGGPMYGGQRQRLVHMVNNSSASAVVPMVHGIGDSSEDLGYRYESTRVKQLNAALPFEVSFTATAPCEDAHCQQLNQEFGLHDPSPTYEHRYILLPDGADGPSEKTLAVIRSNSVPLISTIFREWFSERLLPWVHFVPIDLRYHGLHSTMGYFIGLQGRGPVNGRQSHMEGRREDARWIAEQGQRWADSAIRQEDMKIYLFRLLLEWGRVQDDNRDQLGFSLPV